MSTNNTTPASARSAVGQCRRWVELLRAGVAGSDRRSGAWTFGTVLEYGMTIAFMADSVQAPARASYRPSDRNRVSARRTRTGHGPLRGQQSVDVLPHF